MRSRRLPRRAFLALAVLAGVSFAEEATKTSTETTPVHTPCVATSINGAFFDLRPDIAVAVAEGEKPPRGTPTEDYVARGWDYGYNFTLNICEPVVKKVEDVVGVDKALWPNISAYYEADGKIYSLGQQSGELIPRGRKLVLQYTGGSPCGPSEKSADKRSKVHGGARSERFNFDDEDEDYHPPEDDEEDDDKKDKKKGEGEERGGGRDDEDDDREKDNGKGGANQRQLRKSASISFLCDHDPDTPTAFSFAMADPYECAYFFEVRSQHACAAAEPHKPGSVGPGSVFAIIFFITVMVYVVGGVFYQRTVAHARGWRQLPNYSMWAGIWSFIKDLLIILTASCARLVPRRRGYHTLSGSPNGRHRNRDDENRLIDQLDEEWD
ncbi:hypothetical protein MYCTH_2305350, partial [Thermothelomyces thermophilus ATCC 42464]